MILGLSTADFTLIHVILSLVGIAAGLVAIFQLVAGRLHSRWTAIFLTTTVLTSLTGFLFPNKTITPGIVLGILSMIALLVATVALYARKLAGGWRGTYVISASVALYFNVFVLFAQLFAKVPALKAIAPTNASPAFGITQLIVLAGFVVLTIRALKGFRGA
ncbi:MAG: hypothetical protein ABR956_01820 [Terracidiphilus sp.]|jgi:hypothetical protein